MTWGFAILPPGRGEAAVSERLMLSHSRPTHASFAAACSAALCLVSQIAGAADTYRAPRTADGDPDLQGTWTNATLTPLERLKR